MRIEFEAFLLHMDLVDSSSFPVALSQSLQKLVKHMPHKQLLKMTPACA